MLSKISIPLFFLLRGAVPFRPGMAAARYRTYPVSPTPRHRIAHKSTLPVRALGSAPQRIKRPSYVGYDPRSCSYRRKIKNKVYTPQVSQYNIIKIKKGGDYTGHDGRPARVSRTRRDVHLDKSIRNERMDLTVDPSGLTTQRRTRPLRSAVNTDGSKN